MSFSRKTGWPEIIGAFIGILLILAIPVALLIGYAKNVIAFANLDFQEPYKAEVIRAAGVIMPPVGVIEGYFVTFEEEKK